MILTCYNKSLGSNYSAIHPFGELVADGLTNALVKLPLVYLMDCTLNDCSLILKPLVQV